VFDHYPDMNHDGKVDIYDVATFHELMDEDERREQEESYPTYHYSGSKAFSGGSFLFYVILALIFWGAFKLFFFILGLIF